MAIVIAILVALALIGLGYSAFLSDSDDGESSNADTSEEMTAEQEAPVVDTSPIESADEVTTEVNELTEDIESLSDDLDFDESELSDEALDL